MTPRYTPLLAGIGFVGYRSFANDWQQMEFPSKVTVLAGVNNSGKSNVLEFLQNILPQLRSRGQLGPRIPVFKGLDEPVGFASRVAPRVGTPINLGVSPAPTRRELQSGTPASNDLEVWTQFAMHLLQEDGVYWSVFEAQRDEGRPPRERVQAAMDAWHNWGNRSGIAVRLMGGGPTDPAEVMSNLLVRAGGFAHLPSVSTIKSSRRVETLDAGEDQDLWLSGRGIVKALARIQSPSHGDWAVARQQWDAINRFVQVVLDDPSALINVPHDASTIQVETPTRVLPLAHLGSGIEQVIILAAAATVTRGQLVCIEEPETNLHPLLQKKFIRYLVDETDNQYVIATHSSHLLDDARATAYHLHLSETGTQVRRARLPHELVAICNDLGYRPSDLLQANSVIWVEGPSDRIYLRRWLALVAPHLAEGIDYSIMFYGGRLLAHLSVDPGALQDFIDLRQLNRASAVIIDSDRENSRQRIGATKRRILDEFGRDDAPGLAWVTRCYTIENYVPPAVLQEAVSEVHPGRTMTGRTQWDNPLKTAPGESPFDKIAIARAVEVRTADADLDRLDLKARVLELASFITHANGLP